MKNEKGQTTVEYILLMAVIISIMMSVFNQLEGYFLQGPNSIQGQFQSIFQNSISSNSAFKYFRIRR
ncbi:MAG: hypothetical protein CME62_12730 [Halobacteriovoraceae bacterium]|nr:hypothetical protein [Halobacteriovoraceae bacterium]